MKHEFVYGECLWLSNECCLSCPPICHVHLSVMSTHLSCPPVCHVHHVCHVHPSVMSTRLSCPPICHVHPSVMSTCLHPSPCPPICHVHPSFMSTHLSCLQKLVKPFFSMHLLAMVIKRKPTTHIYLLTYLVNINSQCLYGYDLFQWPFVLWPWPSDDLYLNIC